MSLLTLALVGGEPVNAFIATIRINSVGKIRVRLQIDEQYYYW